MSFRFQNGTTQFQYHTAFDTIAAQQTHSIHITAILKRCTVHPRRSFSRT